MTKKPFSKILYGADYNPEQWDESVWEDDIKLMQEAGVNMVTLAVFSWAKINPRPGVFCFDWLDRIVNKLHGAGIWVDMATATASPPAWLAQQFPDVRPMDENGQTYYHGSRQAFSPNSPSYRKFSAELVTALALHYKEHPALVMWHINNEFACHLSSSYTAQDEIAWRLWLKQKYKTLDTLNEAWGTEFWSQTYYDWEEILLPRKTPYDINPAQKLDAHRFFSDSFVECLINERKILKQVTPNIPVTTNYVGFKKELDQFKCSRFLDVVSFDSYPDPDPELKPYGDPLGHDVTRATACGKPYILMEQVTSQVNWRETNMQKRPGVMRLWSYQTLARGGDGVLFFQWRKSQFGAEKFHGAIVEHGDPHKSRTFLEVCQLGEELKALSDICGSKFTAEAAILVDWENWWAVELGAKPARFNYPEQVGLWHKAFFAKNIPIDVAHPDDENFSRYKVIVAPLLYLLKDTTARALHRFVEQGGTLLVTFFSGIVNENDRVQIGGYPAKLRELLGIWVEAWDPYPKGRENSLITQEGNTYPCTYFNEIIHTAGAEVLATFGSDYYAGQPALTCHGYGKGKAYYLGTQPNEAFREHLLQQWIDQEKLSRVLDSDSGIEITCREKAGQRFIFLLNHRETPGRVFLGRQTYKDLLTGESLCGEITLAAKDCKVLGT